LVEQAKRRKFTARYKLEILEKAEACTRPGEIGEGGVFADELRVDRSGIGDASADADALVVSRDGVESQAGEVDKMPAVALTARHHWHQQRPAPQYRCRLGVLGKDLCCVS